MFTILGGSGFIGSNLVRHLKAGGVDCQVPARGETLDGKRLGHVIYCVGLTADFRQRPFETVEAHVCHLSRVLQNTDYDSFLYLSTTRLYAGASEGLESASFRVDPARADDLYNISKIMGESLCGASRRADVRIARLANVFGADFSSSNFLTSVIGDAVRKGTVLLQTSLESEKDYVDVDDVVALLPRIAMEGRHRLYNVASGANTSNGEIVRIVEQLTSCSTSVAEAAPIVKFPRIAIDRIRGEFGFEPRPLLDRLPALIGEYRRWES